MNPSHYLGIEHVLLPHRALLHDTGVSGVACITRGSAIELVCREYAKSHPWPAPPYSPNRFKHTMPPKKCGYTAAICRKACSQAVCG